MGGMSEEQLQAMEASAPLLVKSYREMRKRYQDTAARVALFLIQELGRELTPEVAATVMAEFVS